MSLPLYSDLMQFTNFVHHLGVLEDVFVAHCGLLGDDRGRLMQLVRRHKVKARLLPLILIIFGFRTTDMHIIICNCQSIKNHISL